MKVIALVDGEHYPSVTRWGLETAASMGYSVVAALAVGGVEKLSTERDLPLGDVPVIHGEAGPRDALAAAIDSLRPDAVIDLSDEPVLPYERRMEIAAVALVAGIPYIGPDFRFDPPVTGAPLPVAAVGVIGTGKRVGKTAVAGHLARLCASRGTHPVIVAMGRGGPPGPVIAGRADVDVQSLIARVQRGEHAASDFLEDALTAGVTTVGARRCGGGLAGKPFVTNVAEAAAAAAALNPNLVILEGSGASVPTIPWDAGILVLPASMPVAHLEGHLGPFRVLLSDVAVFMMDVGPFAGPDNLSTLYPLVRRLRANIRVAVAELVPVPMAEVRGKDAFFATTAQREAGARQKVRLEQTSGCRVVMTSPHLSDRVRLEQDLAAAPRFDVLLTELKGAAVDVAARRALDRGAEVVFVDNRPHTVSGDAGVDELLTEAAELAQARAADRLHVGG